MSEGLSRRDRALGRRTAAEIRDGARPTTNQPLHAAPRPWFTPALLVVAIVVLALVILLALTLV